MNQFVDIEKLKKYISKLYDQGALYNFPNIKFERFEMVDLLDIQTILIKDENENNFLTRADRKILINAIVDRYKGVNTSLSVPKKLKTAFVRDMFQRIIERQGKEENQIFGKSFRPQIFY